MRVCEWFTERGYAPSCQLRRQPMFNVPRTRPPKASHSTVTRFNTQYSQYVFFWSSASSSELSLDCDLPIMYSLVGQLKKMRWWRVESRQRDGETAVEGDKMTAGGTRRPPESTDSCGCMSHECDIQKRQDTWHGAGSHATNWRCAAACRTVGRLGVEGIARCRVAVAVAVVAAVVF